MYRDDILAIRQTYKAYQDKNNRCTPGHAQAKYYYYRGITKGDDWASPLEFIRWSLYDGGFALGLSLDRINNNLGYSKVNCRWTTASVQNQNQSTTKLNTEKVDLIRHLLENGNLWQPEIGRIFGVRQNAISRIKTGKRWKVVESVAIPIWQVTDEEIENVIRLYKTWKNMKFRVTPGYVKAHRYFVRGILLSKEWENDFSTFAMWVLSNGYEPDLTIDRIDNDGNYTPENCRWATYAEQNQNQSTTKLDPKKVMQIRDICEQTNLVNREVAEIYGVHSDTIGQVRRNKSWKNIEPKELQNA